MGVDFVGLVDSAAGDVFMNIGGHSWPPVIPLQ